MWAFQNQQIDAYPDISGQMVEVITTYPGRAPEEVEQQVTIPIEIAMRTVPRVNKIRSRTIFGLSIVDVLFSEGVENYWARQRVQEQLGNATLPPNVQPNLAPLATAYGEIFRYELVAKDGVCDQMELRTLQDWVVVPRMFKCDGVADVANFGGHLKQYTVTFIPAQLQRNNLALSNVINALQSNNSSAGGSVLARGSMSFVIRGKGTVRDIAEIGAIFIKSVGGVPIYLRDVAVVELDYPPPTGIFSKDHHDESIEGIVVMRRGENPSQVLARVQAAVVELNSGLLPKGVRVKDFYDRTLLIQNTLHTVAHSVTLGITLVVLVLLLFLGRPSMAALVALTIPFALLVAMLLMYVTSIPIGLLSVGAIDFGIIVNGAVIMAENIAHRLGGAGRARTQQNVKKIVLAATLEVERPVFFSVLMIIGAYLPLLSLVSIEGLLFRPMALTLVFALLGALFFALFVVPVLATFLFRHGYREWENPLLRWFRPIYSACLHRLLQARWVVAGVVALLLAAVFVRVLPRLGTEFLPYMDEGVIWVRANFPEGTAIEQTARFGKRVREVLLEFPEIKYVTIQSGRNDSGTDPFPPSRMEMMVGPKSRNTWKRFHDKHELVAEMGRRLRDEFPTTRFNFTQPIIDSVTEDTNGTSANLAIEFSGPDPDELLRLARQAEQLLRKVRGAIDVSIEQEGPQPQLVIVPDRALIARQNVRNDNVMQLINTALGGQPVGTLYEGDRRFDIVAKLDRSVVTSPEAIGRLPVYNADGNPVPLAQVAHISLVDGQTIIARENGRRRLTVRCDISGRDQGGFVADAQQQFAKAVEVPEGYRVEWLGMFENLARAGPLHDPDPHHDRADLRLVVGDLRLAAGGDRGPAGGALRLHRRRTGDLRAGHAPQHVQRRGLHRPVRRGHHGRCAHGPLDLDLAHPRHGTRKSDRRGRDGAAAAHSYDFHRRHLRPSAGLAGHGPRLRRAAAAGHGHRLGPLQFHDAHALRRAGLLSPAPARTAQASRLRRRFRGRGPLACRAPARRLHERHRRPAGTPQRPRRTAGRVPYLRRDEPRVRPRDRRRQGRRNARFHRNAGAHRSPYGQGQGLCRRRLATTQGPVARATPHLAALPRRAGVDCPQPKPRHRPRFRARDDRDADALRELRKGLQHLHPLVPLLRPVRLRRDDAIDFAGAAGHVRIGSSQVR